MRITMRKRGTSYSFAVTARFWDLLYTAPFRDFHSRLLARNPAQLQQITVICYRPRAVEGRRVGGKRRDSKSEDWILYEDEDSQSRLLHTLLLSYCITRNHFQLLISSSPFAFLSFSRHSQEIIVNYELWSKLCYNDGADHHAALCRGARRLLRKAVLGDKCWSLLNWKSYRAVGIGNSWCENAAYSNMHWTFGYCSKMTLFVVGNYLVLTRHSR